MGQRAPSGWQGGEGCKHTDTFAAACRAARLNTDKQHQQMPTACESKQERRHRPPAAAGGGTHASRPSTILMSVYRLSTVCPALETDCSRRAGAASGPVERLSAAGARAARRSRPHLNHRIVQRPLQRHPVQQVERLLGLLLLLELEDVWLAGTPLGSHVETLAVAINRRSAPKRARLHAGAAAAAWALFLASCCIQSFTNSQRSVRIFSSSRRRSETRWRQLWPAWTRRL